MTENTTRSKHAGPGPVEAAHPDAPQFQPVPTVSLLGLVGSTVVGWAEPVTADRASAVELFIDGKLVDAAEANRPAPSDREMAQLEPAETPPSAISAAHDWFSLKTPQELRTGRELLFEVRRVEGDLVGRGRFRLFGGLKGKLVGIHDGVAQGFVANPFGEEAPPPLELRLDGQPLAQIELEPPAPDGRRRFNARLPQDIHDGEMHDVEVVWAGSNVALPGSPQRWQAPKPKPHHVIKAREIDQAARKSRPAYVLPAAELAAIAGMLRSQALRRGASALVAENAATVWRALEQPAPAAGARLCIVLTASTFTDVESSFALGQLLALYPGAAVRVMLPSQEAVRFAADDLRDSGRDGLAPTFANGAFAAFAARLPADDLVVFIPAHAVLSTAFLDKMRAIVDERSEGVVAFCAQAMATPGSLILTTPAPAAWSSSRDCAAVLRGAELATRARVGRFEFEGVRFDEIELQIGQSEPGGAIVQIASPPRTAAANSLIVLVRHTPDLAALAHLENLAERRTVAGVAPSAAPEGWTGIAAPEGLGQDPLALAAGLADGKGDVIVVDAAAANDLAADLSACRILASGAGAHAIRRVAAPPQLTDVAHLQQLVSEALAAPASGLYVSAR